MDVSDFELIARVRARDDRAAFTELVVRHQSTVRNFLRQLTRGDAALADDLTQETFVDAYRSLARFRGDAKFSTWLLGIAHNHWRNARRKIRDQVEWTDAATPEAVATLGTSDLRQDLASALSSLSADERLALHLGYDEGLSHAEIAALVDWPLGTVKTHLARSKAKLRHLLAAWNPQT